MQFKVPKDEILIPLQHISKIANSKSIPILSGVLITVDPELMILVGGDSNNMMRYELSKDKFTFMKSGSVVLPIDKLFEIIKKMDEDWIQVELLENDCVHIVSGDSNFRLVGMDAGEYPQVRLDYSGIPIELNGEVLKVLINQTIYAISSREDNPLLTGVHIKLNDKLVCFTACDRHRVARMTVMLASGVSAENIISGKALVDIKHILKDDLPVHINFLEQRMLFKQGSLTYAVTPMEGKYPNIEKMISMESSSKVVVSTPKLLRSLERSMIISDSSMGFITTMQINNDHLRISCQSDNGYMDENIVLESATNDIFEIKCNVKFALDALKTIRTEKTAIHYNRNQKLIVFKPHEQESALHLIMGALK